jgi:DNA mismatch endonuclease (patch repair protein)
MERALRTLLPSGRFSGVTPDRSKKMRSVRGTGNRTTEGRLRFALVACGIGGWKMHVADLPGRPDFAFRAKKIAVFVDGCFWHGCRKCGHVPATNASFWSAKLARNRRRDIATTRALKGLGYLVLRFWEHELQRDVQSCLTTIRHSLMRRRRQ